MACLKPTTKVCVPVRELRPRPLQRLSLRALFSRHSSRAQRPVVAEQHEHSCCQVKNPNVVAARKVWLQLHNQLEVGRGRQAQAAVPIFQGAHMNGTANALQLSLHLAQRRGADASQNPAKESRGRIERTPSTLPAASRTSISCVSSSVQSKLRNQRPAMPCGLTLLIDSGDGPFTTLQTVP